MAQTFPLPSFTIPAGSLTRTVTNLNSAFSTIDLTVLFTAFPSTAVLSYTMQVSEDGGVTWRDYGGCMMGPGLANRQGPTLTHRAQFACSQGVSASAQWRITLTSTDILPVSGGSVVVS